MNKAKTLKRRLGNPKPFLSVAWDTNDITSQLSVNPNLKWKDIDRQWVEKNVFKLQKLIYRASSRGEIRKMHKYQRLLTKSCYARLLAIRRVKQDNQIKKTAGVDGIKNLPPMQRFKLVYLLKTRNLKVSLTYRVWIPKPGKDEKPSLGIPTMYERVLQALVKLGMEPEWETGFEPNSYGFRPGRLIHDTIEAIYCSIRNKPKYVLDSDISKCMSRVNHDALLGKIANTPYRRLFKKWLKSGVFDNSKFLDIVEGTPKGGIISPLLPNIALHSTEARLIKFAKNLDMKNKHGRQIGWQDKVNSLTLVRSTDNFVILHEDIKILLQAKAVIQEWLKQLGLELKPGKTIIAHTLEEYEGNIPGFDFLGFTIRQGQAKSTEFGYKKLIKPSSKSIKIHYRKLADVCDSHKIAPVKALIAKLNPVKRGWANYYSTVVSKEVFNEIDHLLLKRLGRWGNRRHPKKSATWVKKKYFPSIGTKTWVLNNGEYILIQHSDVPIRRHIKVKGTTSPYDRNLTYWSNRKGKYLGVRKEVKTLLKQQRNKCASCGITFRPTDLRSVDKKKDQGLKVVTTHLRIKNCCTDIATILKLPHVKNILKTIKLQALPDDILILRQGCTHNLGRLGEEPCEVKVSRTVLKTSRVG